MNRMLITGAVAASLALPTLSFAHGGTYRGPQDTTPPSGGSGGGGNGPQTPTPGGPGQPGPNGPSTGRPVTPGQPGGGPGTPRGPVTPAGGDSADLSGWEYWWAFNKEPYLALKSRLASAVLTGSVEYYLGRGEAQEGRDTLRISEERVRSQIVPKLLAALANEHSNDIQSSCMIALAKIGEAKSEDGSAPIADAIRPFLASSSQELSETAAVALGILADSSNIACLTAVLENDVAELRAQGLAKAGEFSVRTRAFAAYGLGLIGHRATNVDRTAINRTLRKLLDGEGRRMAQRDIQVACLTAIGLSPLAPVMDVQADSLPADFAKPPADLDGLEAQLQYLLAFYGDESVPFLIRAHAPTAMARLLAASDTPDDSPLRARTAEALMRDLTKQSKAANAMQESCVLALGAIGDSDEDPLDKAIRSTLMSVKDDVDGDQARNFSLVALAQAASRAGDGLGDPLHGVDAKDRRENARSFLLGELAKGKSSVASWSAISLAVLERALDDQKLGSSTDTKLALAAELEKASAPSSIGALAIACGISGSTAAQKELLRRLDETNDPEARGYVAVSLGLLNDRNALAPVTALLKKSKYQPELLKSTAVALGLLGDRQVVDGLVEMLDDATSLSSQAAISSALGFIGDVRSVDPLIRLLDDQEKTALARAFAAVSLGLIADKEPLPWNSKIAVNSNYRANTATLTNQASGILDIL